MSNLKKIAMLGLALGAAIIIIYSPAAKAQDTFDLDVCKNDCESLEDDVAAKDACKTGCDETNQNILNAANSGDLGGDEDLSGNSSGGSGSGSGSGGSITGLEKNIWGGDDVDVQELLGSEGVGLGSKDPREMIASIIKLVLGFLGIIAVVIILIGGFKWMTAGGNEDQVGEAKKWIYSGVIGLLIIFSAYALASWVLTQLTTKIV